MTTTDSRREGARDTTRPSAAAPDFLGTARCDTSSPPAEGPTPAGTGWCAATSMGASGPLSDRTSTSEATQATAVGAPSLGTATPDTTTPYAEGPIPDRNRWRDTKPQSAVGAQQVSQVDTPGDDTTATGVDLADPSLAMLAATVDDLERVRKATANRLRILTTLAPDSDGVIRGFGLPVTHSGVQSMTELAAQVETWEADAVRRLERRMKAHPLGEWVKRTPGVGAKSIARVLGAIGDPAIHPHTGKPRTFGQLKSYCGLAPGQDGASPRPKRGEGQVRYNPTARMRLYVAINPMVNLRKDADGSGPTDPDWQPTTFLGEAYKAARASRVDFLHLHPCKLCGPSGKPAEPGTPWPAKHQHGHGLHMMMVALLRALWDESRALHGLPDELPGSALRIATPRPAAPTPGTDSSSAPPHAADTSRAADEAHLSAVAA